MSILNISSSSFAARLTQPQLWILQLAALNPRKLLSTDDIHEAKGSGSFSRQVISYSLRSLAKRGLISCDNTERQSVSIKLTPEGRRLIRGISSNLN